MDFCGYRRRFRRKPEPFILEHVKAWFPFTISQTKLYKRTVKIILILLFSLSCFISYSDQKVLPPESGIYHTAFSTMYSSSNNVSENEVPYFVNLVNKKIVWLNFSNDWFEGIKFPAQSVKNIYKSGSLPSIRIMPWSNYDKHDKKIPAQKNCER